MVWVSLIKAMEFTVDKKFGLRFLLRDSTWYCRADPISPQSHPLGLSVHSFRLQVTPVQNKPQQQSCRDRRLWIWGIPFTQPHMSPDPLKEEQASSVTKNMLPELLHFEFAVPWDYECPNQQVFFAFPLFFKPKILSLMDLVCPCDLQRVAVLQKQAFNSGFVRV